MQKILFHNSHDIKNKLHIIIHADKISVQKETTFSQTKPRAFSQALLLWNSQKWKVTSWYTITNDNIAYTKTSYLLSKNNHGVVISKTNCFKLISKQFLFSKCKMKISKFILGKDSFTKTKNEKGEKVYSKPSFVWVTYGTHLRAMASIKGQYYS